MKTVKHTEVVEGTFGKMQLVHDFLPRPEELVLKKPMKKITITLDSASVDFFKKEAARLNSSYQRMMRNLLTEYANRMRARQEPQSG